MPGGKFEGGEPVWFSDAGSDARSERAQVAANCDLHSAFWFPVVAGDEIVAVMEFFDPGLIEPDDVMMATILLIGTHMGRVYERDQAERNLRATLRELDVANNVLAAEAETLV